MGGGGTSSIDRQGHLAIRFPPPALAMPHREKGSLGAASHCVRNHTPGLPSPLPWESARPARLVFYGQPPPPAHRPACLPTRSLGGWTATFGTASLTLIKVNERLGCPPATYPLVQSRGGGLVLTGWGPFLLHGGTRGGGVVVEPKLLDFDRPGYLHPDNGEIIFPRAIGLSSKLGLWLSLTLKFLKKSNHWPDNFSYALCFGCVLSGRRAAAGRVFFLGRL